MDTAQRKQKGKLQWEVQQPKWKYTLDSLLKNMRWQQNKWLVKQVDRKLVKIWKAGSSFKKY